MESEYLSGDKWESNGSLQSGPNKSSQCVYNAGTKWKFYSIHLIWCAMLKKTYMSVPSYMDIGMIDIYLLAKFDKCAIRHQCHKHRSVVILNCGLVMIYLSL